MIRLDRIVLAAFLSAGLVVPPPVHADDKDKKAEQLSEKERKKKAKQTLKELETPYRKWLDEEVSYIILPEERTAFLQLSTNEEREQFIEQFWQRRNPNPDLAENSFKEEHYRRITYANERFASGIPGWKTDRGRIYIMWGKPDEIESHPAGGAYSRPMEEGGGETSTYPFEKWRYRYLEGIGNDVNLEFVDPSGSGEYRLTMDPSEKDALSHVPGAGLSLLESMGMANKADRFTRSDGTNLPKGLNDNSAAMNEFNRLELYAKIQRPPEVKFKDLEALVTSRIVRNQMQFEYRFDFLRVVGDTVLVPITIQIPNRQLTFQNKDGVHSATLNIFCRISTLTGRMVQTFEDPVSKDFPDSLLEASLKLQSIYQKAIPLRPGRYRLDIVIKDVNSGNVGVISTVLPVPRYDDDKLSASSLILADQLEPVPAKQIGTGQFVLGSYKVRPRLNGEFTTDQKLGIYMQLYNFKVDETTHRPKASIQYKVTKGGQEVWGITEFSDQFKQASDQITLERQLPLSPLGPGKYKLEITATDQLNNQTITKTAEFTVKAAAEVKAAAYAPPGR